MCYDMEETFCQILVMVMHIKFENERASLFRVMIHLTCSN